ncbi:hypothetical protein H4P1_00074 (plasmid) [Variovorax sp. PBS-H4]|uniref:hypothetical protein n=1 Tax=Variovorax sp. PBS-H4 TaxID=434008 RepID=UPI0013187976|nr:hypothetical protein [Variovorax sp. PBS-H4]VTU41447.1 hypothetical protein H4P1_00074 [Variovorax sp. PBS-H4]
MAAVLFVARGELYGAVMWSAAGGGVGPAIIIFLIDGLHRAAASFSVSVGGFMLAGLAAIRAAIVLVGGLWIRNALQRNSQW